MKVLLVKQPGEDLSAYHAILQKRGVDFAEHEAQLEGDVLTSDSAKAKWCDIFYKKYGETIDGIQFFLPLKDWPESRRLLGRMFNREFSGYLTSCTRMRRGYEKTAEHELLHKVDNWIKIYLGISIERILNVADWDDVVVHGDVPNDGYTEYSYDLAWQQVNPYLTQALAKRKRTALLGYMELLIIKLRALIIQLEAKIYTMTALKHPLEGFTITYKYGVPDSAYALTGHHIGTDYGTPLNTPVLAPKDGEIVVAGKSASLGNFCHFKYTHDGQVYVARFLHLNAQPKPGLYKSGAVIALTGNTGMSSGPHCHIDIWKNEVRLDLVNTTNWQQITVDPEEHFAG